MSWLRFCLCPSAQLTPPAYLKFEADRKAASARTRAVFPPYSERRLNTGEIETMLEAVEAEIECRERERRRARREVVGMELD